jgi:hypothetical protein
MNSWSNPESIVALCGAFAALVTAIAAAWHSINTRQTANTAATIAKNATINSLRAISIATVQKLPDSGNSK